MEPPTINELKDFTLNQYVGLIKFLKNNYRIVPFRDVSFRDTPYLILRHDIDISLRDALKMAKIENELNIKSTYFVLFSSGFYNLFEGENMAILVRILELGHEIGLHYHPAQYALYKRNPKKMLLAEIRTLEEFLDIKIHTIARHGPWDRDPFSAIRRYKNANHPYFRSDLFVHDSNRAWVTLRSLSVLLNSPPKRVQLLVHPENWQNDKVEREKLLENHVKSLEDKIQHTKKNLLENYRTDQFVIDYDKAIKKADFMPFKYNNTNRTNSSYNFPSLFRYYLIYSKIGWNLHKLREKTANSFSRFRS